MNPGDMIVGPGMAGAALLGKDKVKSACMQSMKIMYPKGIGTAQQHRDVILNYLVGWANGLQVNGHTMELEKFIEEVKFVRDPNWMPDISWVWWT